MIRSVALIAPMLIATAVPLMAQSQQAYDVILRGGTVYDGTGSPGRLRGRRHPRRPDRGRR